MQHLYQAERSLLYRKRGRRGDICASKDILKFFMDIMQFSIKNNLSDSIVLNTRVARNIHPLYFCLFKDNDYLGHFCRLKHPTG